MSDLHDDEALWEDDLLEEPEPPPIEPEGPVTEDEALDDLGGLLQEPPPPDDPRYDEAQIGADGDDFEDLGGLLSDSDDEDLSWIQEDPQHAPYVETPSTPRTLPWRIHRPAPEPPPLKALTVGYRLKVGLPDFEVEGLPGRCMVHRAWSSLRIPVRGKKLGARVRLSFGDKDLSLPVLHGEHPAVQLRLVVAGRELEATLRLAHSDGPVRVLLGRDTLAAAALVVDVREDQP